MFLRLAEQAQPRADNPLIPKHGVPATMLKPITAARQVRMPVKEPGPLPPIK